MNHWLLREELSKTFKPLREYALTSPSTAYKYAKDVIKGRFVEGEPLIATDSIYSAQYALDVLKERFPLYEAEIAKLDKPNEINTVYSILYYATSVVNEGRFIAGEKILSKSWISALQYAKRCIKGRFPLGEEAISSEPSASLSYAKLINGRFKLGEKAIAEHESIAIEYLAFLGITE